QQVFLRAALAAALNKLVAVLKVVMALHWRGDVIARVERRAVQRLDQSDIVLVDDRRVGVLDFEQPRFDGVVFNRDRIGQDAVSSGRQDFDLRPLLTRSLDELLSVLEVAMAFDGHPEQTSGVERGAVRRRYDADLALWNHDGLRDRNTEQIRMNGPQARRQRPHLDAFYAASFDERDRVLEI